MSVLPRRRPRTSAPHRDRWVIPYADFMTLLFALFTALYAVAAAEPSRLTMLADGLKVAFGAPDTQPLSAVHAGALDHGRGIVGRADRGPVAGDGDTVRRAIERELADDFAMGRLEMTEDRRGLVLAIPEAFSFADGHADLSGGAPALMARIGGVLAGLPNALRVEGHTDNTPIHNDRYTSNFELSTARATEVIAFFITHSGIAPSRLSASGYSEYHPRATNDTPEGRTRNRRVDIVILNPATTATEEP